MNGVMVLVTLAASLGATIAGWFAWAAAHPAIVGPALLGLLSIVGATASNGRKTGAPATRWERFIDRLSIRTRRGAANEGWTWPMVGRSAFQAAVDVATGYESAVPGKPATVPPPTAVPPLPAATPPATAAGSASARDEGDDGPEGPSGYATRDVLLWVAVVLTLCLVASRCLPPADGCTPGAERCSPSGAPQVCSPSQRWTPASIDCAREGAVCCLATSSRGRRIVACLPASACEGAAPGADADVASGVAAATTPATPATDGGL